eukprot:TRINITY_DN9314_c0_g1_i1.p1 TRINITY_DN9314_c0_g1~~TRINITY_DN9314_c0_g1_i1.p1  ORF type:complete len:602 (+),score=150.90 TRINITY_DN9314_c0_g1_i1:132-1937(+)
MSSEVEDIIDAEQEDILVEKANEEQHTTDSFLILILLGLLFVTILLVWRFKVKRYIFIHETGVSLILGLLTGLVMDQIERSDGIRAQHPAVCNETLRLITRANLTHEEYESTDIESAAVFDPELFFYVLLPPIIFYAGYDLKQKHFFRNIGLILLFAFIGTSIACFLSGGLLYAFVDANSLPLTLQDCLLFGALISATDPVTVLAIFHDLGVEDRLYAIVFGESVLNDAVALVMYRSISDFNPELHTRLTTGRFFYSIWVFLLIFFGSFACGAFVGMASSIFFKFSSIKRFPLLETAVFLLLSYCSFLLGEGFGLSGVVSVLFCGIAQAHYTYPTLSEEGQRRTKELLQLVNFLFENFLFSYIGLNVFTYKCHRWEVGFIAFSIFVVLLARAVHVLLLSNVANRVTRKPQSKISLQYQAMMWWAGLRGAIAFALAIRNTTTVAHQMILSATLVIVIKTVLVFGGTTPAVLQALKIKTGHQEADPMDQYMLAGNRVGKPAKGWLATMWQGVDRKFIRPTISITPDMDGTESWSSVKETVGNYWKGIPETLPERPAEPVQELRNRTSSSLSNGHGANGLMDGEQVGAFSPNWDRARADDPFAL